MAKAPPAFQFYPDSFEQGTDTMTLAQVGGYIRLLNSQWAKGSIPGDDIAALSRILRCTIANAKPVWSILREKFERGADGQYRNARLERERAKQQKFHGQQSDRGKLSAAARANRGSTAVEPALQPEGNQPWFNPPSPSPDPSTRATDRSSTTPSVAAHAPPTSKTTPREFDRTHAGHVHGFCGFKCLSEEKIQLFAKDLPGGLSDPENFNRVLAWAEQVRDTWGDAPKVEFEWWLFWEARWKDRAGAADPKTLGAKNRAVLQRLVARHS